MDHGSTATLLLDGALREQFRSRLARRLLVNDSGKPLDTYSLYHIGLGVSDKAAVIESYLRAKAQGVPIVKPPRTTWRGTPLHELWLRDPTGYGIEVYARLTAEELAAMPADQEPTYLVPGTGPRIPDSTSQRPNQHL